jgi:hypothetical protein
VVRSAAPSLNPALPRACRRGEQERPIPHVAQEGRSWKLVGLLSTVAAIALAAPAAASAAQFEGTVVSVNRDNRTFRLHDSERGTIRIKVTSSTRFERVAGFAGLRKGMTRIEATVRRSNGRWVASSVQRSGGGGRHGNDD